MFVAKSKKDWPFLNQKPLEYFNTNSFFRRSVVVQWLETYVSYWKGCFVSVLDSGTKQQSY